MHDSIEIIKDMGPASIASYLIIKEVFSFIKMRKNGSGQDKHVTFTAPRWLIESITEIKTHMRAHTKLLEKLVCNKSSNSK